MPRFLTRLVPVHGTQSLRVTVTWRKRRVRAVKFEYARPHLLRRLINAMR
jgi:hypothetical protein